MSKYRKLTVSKYLGVISDNKISWKSQITCLCG